VRSLLTKGIRLMTGLEWFLTTILMVMYIFLIFTVALITFRKGYFVLGFLGIFLPFLWLIGALLPDKHEGMMTGTGRMTPSM
jgi:hypothetical protein